MCDISDDPRVALLDDEHVPRDVFLSVHRFAEWAGVGLDGRPIGQPNVLQYDGHTIGVGGQRITDIIHDIAHHVVAPEWRRSHPDWGLGSGVDEYSNFGKKDDEKLHIYPKTIEMESTQDQELLASLLGTCVEYHLGLGIQTLKDHNWEGSWKSLNDFWQEVINLQNMGLITNDRGRPTFMDHVTADGSSA